MQEKTVVEITFEDAQGGQEKSRFECQDSVVLGGVFVPVDSLPGWLQAIAWLLPMTYSIEVLNLAVVTLARNIE